MNLAGKVWGETREILSRPLVEFHRVSVRAGGYCSKHYHRHKWNGFYVVSGILKIRVWMDDYDLVDETTLGAGEFMSVKPGRNHQFEAVTDVDAFELYWIEPLSADIIRESVGGYEGERPVVDRSNVREQPLDFLREELEAIFSPGPAAAGAFALTGEPVVTFAGHIKDEGEEVLASPTKDEAIERFRQHIMWLKQNKPPGSRVMWRRLPRLVGDDDRGYYVHARFCVSDKPVGPAFL